uniref:Uncharacterized protein n=1 Tax=Lepidodinium chlorophorum TaxID=107758 RepID=A0A0F7R0Z2_LEPCH|nr:hypothetical protein [Lepidodinium chlorophorum]BAR72355.1 hypothetical protein [Lepidodinium chlorophorum]
MQYVSPHVVFSSSPLEENLEDFRIEEKVIYDGKGSQNERRKNLEYLAKNYQKNLELVINENRIIERSLIFNCTFFRVPVFLVDKGKKISRLDALFIAMIYLPREFVSYMKTKLDVDVNILSRHIYFMRTPDRVIRAKDKSCMIAVSIVYSVPGKRILKNQIIDFRKDYFQDPNLALGDVTPFNLSVRQIKSKVFNVRDGWVFTPEVQGIFDRSKNGPPVFEFDQSTDRPILRFARLLSRNVKIHYVTEIPTDFPSISESSRLKFTEECFQIFLEFFGRLSGIKILLFLFSIV